MANFNKVILLGNLTRDPELRYTPSGTAVAEFGLAVNRTWKGPNGEKREEATFVDCTAWARTAEVISEYCKKGSPLLVEGRLHLDSWEGKDGQKRNKLKVVVETSQFVGAPTGRRAEGGAPAGRPPQRGRPEPSQEEQSGAPSEPPSAEEPPAGEGPYKVDDEIPF